MERLTREELARMERLARKQARRWQNSANPQNVAYFTALAAKLARMAQEQPAQWVDKSDQTGGRFDCPACGWFYLTGEPHDNLGYKFCPVCGQPLEV